MYFTGDLITKILEHRKTEMRQRVRPGLAGAQRRPCKFRPGGNYPLERPMLAEEADDDRQRKILRGDQDGRVPTIEVGRVLVLSVERGALGNISVDSARAEGFDSPVAFKADWVRRHDSRWIKSQEEAVDAEGVIDVDRHLTDADLGVRFDERWARVQVYVVRFQLQATTYYLAERGRGDYVTTERDRRGRRIAMTTEVIAEQLDPTPAPAGVPTWAHGQILNVPEEAVPPDVVDAWKTDTKSTHQQIKQDIREGRNTGAHHRAEERSKSVVERRITLARERGRLRGIATKPLVYVIRQAQMRKRTPQHIEKLVVALERAVDREEDIADAA